MQGGAADKLVHLSSAVESLKCCDKPLKKKQAQDQVVPPIDTLTVASASEISISPQVDALLDKARELFAWGLATPIAWLHGDVSVAACRERKQQRVQEGSAFVVEIQRRCRTPWLDFYFSFCSFFAEEEFYLLALPTLFWNIDYRLARHMTVVVCIGLLVGNLMKDVFRLPRPSNVEPKVWVPHSASQIDSTGCRDFGFPSTHTMNAVSNSLFWVMYSLQYGIGGKQVGSMTLFVGTCIWVASITFGRLYLGVHSPMDVKAGGLLGLALAFTCQRPLSALDKLDKLFLVTPHVGVLLMIFFVLVLILNPQPRPMTPTFMQNCVVSGLTWGCIIGFRTETDRRLGRGILGLSAAPADNSSNHTGSNDISWGLLVLRTVLGYTLVMMTRIVLKKLLEPCFRKFGMEPNPGKRVPRKDSDPKSSSSKNKQAELRSWDLFAAAAVKTMVYAALAWSITCACPALFEVIGLPCEMNG